MKKLLSLLLALLILAAPVTALAADQTELTAAVTLENVSKYGNVKLSLTCAEMLAAGYTYGDVVTVRFLDETLELPVCSSYTDVESGLAGVFLREGETNVILAVCMGDFATAYGIAVKTTLEDRSHVWNWAEGVGSPVSVTISMKEPGGYREEYLLHQLHYTNERADYPALTDEEFANFRAVETTGMGKGVLYRTSSPVNPTINRNRYADEAIRDAGVTVIMNLADDEAEVRSYETFGQSYYSGTAFIALNMGMDFTTREFQDKLAQGIAFFAEHPGVYCVHCNEGKDRTGFVMALLECLMGANYEEITADYMRTFYNYFGIRPGEEKYDAVLNSNLVKSLTRAFGVSDLAAADLSACAEEYLLQCGLTEETIAALRTNLSGAPQPEPAEEQIYVVAAGDCLWALSMRFYGDPTAWEAIARVNGISDPDTILVGQMLRLPGLAAGESGETVYTVAAGDSLWALARRFYGDPQLWELIARANSLADPDLIYAGQRLRIPGQEP